MRNDQITEMSKTALQAAKFTEAFIQAAEHSPERGAFTAIAFAADMAHRGVPLKEAFQTVCDIIGYSDKDLPRKIDNYKKPPENAQPIEHSMYRIKIAQNALSVARAVLNGDKTYRNDHRINI